MLKAASALAWVSGVGFGVPGVYGIWHFAQYGSVARVMGLPTYGEGAFERIGIHTSLPLLAAFLLVCIGECIAGWLLWSSARAGAVLALALVPVGLMFWIGFSLPFGPVFGLARTVLILMSWSVLAAGAR